MTGRRARYYILKLAATRSRRLTYSGTNWIERK